MDNKTIAAVMAMGLLSGCADNAQDCIDYHAMRFKDPLSIQVVDQVTQGDKITVVITATNSFGGRERTAVECCLYNERYDLARTVVYLDKKEKGEPAQCGG